MSVLQRLRERFWFIPALLCAGAFVLAETLIAVDRRTGDLVVPDWASVALYRVGESGSRDILGAIASSSLAVAGTTFSITIAVLALTSSAFGPRLVRNFMADRGNQTVLGVLVSTFLYSLITLRSIRVLGDPGDPEGEVFVPHLAVNAAVLLAVLDVAALIYFIHHISDSIQVSTLASGVRSDLLRAVDRLYPSDVGREPREAGRPGGTEPVGVPPEVGADAATVQAGRSGYVQSVAGGSLMAVARRHDVVLALQVRPGQFVLEDTVTVLVRPSDRADEGLMDDVRSAIHVADARSPQQDVEFAVQQLTEMAVRALSPGTNDPYTALNALDDLSAGLSRLAAQEPPSSARVDDDGVLRVHAPAVEVADLVGSVVDSMRWYATSAPSVVDAALVLLERVGGAARTPELRAALGGHVDELAEAFAGAGNQERDVIRVRRRADAVRRSLS